MAPDEEVVRAGMGLSFGLRQRPYPDFGLLPGFSQGLGHCLRRIGQNIPSRILGVGKDLLEGDFKDLHGRYDGFHRASPNKISDWGYLKQSPMVCQRSFVKSGFWGW